MDIKKITLLLGGFIVGYFVMCGLSAVAFEYIIWRAMEEKRLIRETILEIVIEERDKRAK